MSLLKLGASWVRRGGGEVRNRKEEKKHGAHIGVGDLKGAVVNSSISIAC